MLHSLLHLVLHSWDRPPRDPARAAAGARLKQGSTHWGASCWRASLHLLCRLWQCLLVASLQAVPFPAVHCTVLLLLLQGLVLDVKGILGARTDVPALLAQMITPPEPAALLQGVCCAVRLCTVAVKWLVWMAPQPAAITADPPTDCCLSHLFSPPPPPPPPTHTHAALTSLRLIGALAAGAEDALTPLGQHLTRMPCDPRIGKMLLYGALLRCLDPVLTIAAAQGWGRPVFWSTPDKRQEVRWAGNGREGGPCY